MKKWLKGGIIGGLVGLVYNILFLIFSYVNAILKITFIGFLFYPLGIFINLWCGLFVFPSCTGDNCSCHILIPQILSIIVIVLIGMLIGLLVRKRRRRLKSRNP